MAADGDAGHALHRTMTYELGDVDHGGFVITA
jgi:hypothetical protein